MKCRDEDDDENLLQPNGYLGHTSLGVLGVLGELRYERKNERIEKNPGNSRAATVQSSLETSVFGSQ